MYEHQIINDLEMIMKRKDLSPSKAGFFFDAVKIAIKDIKMAQHFFLGKHYQILEMVKTITNDSQGLFMGPGSHLIRLPYKLCWFDFENIVANLPIEEDFPRRGMIVKELAPDLIMVTIAARSRKFGFWSLSFQQYLVSIGKLMCDNPAAKLLIPNLSKMRKLMVGNIMSMPMNEYAKTWSNEIAKDDHREMGVLYGALILLNCKNVETVVNRPPVKLNKKRRKAGKQELFSYKTLQLKLPADASRTDLAMIGKEDRRIHLCRGHFKYYSGKNPLFGRYTGFYWWQPHVRGNKKAGVVHKDYAVRCAAGADCP